MSTARFCGSGGGYGLRGVINKCYQLKHSINAKSIKQRSIYPLDVAGAATVECPLEGGGDDPSSSSASMLSW